MYQGLWALPEASSIKGLYQNLSIPCCRTVLFPQEKMTLSPLFHEYKYKLENLYSHFYTKRGSELAKERQQSAVDFYNSLYHEANSSYKNGKNELSKYVQES